MDWQAKVIVGHGQSRDWLASKQNIWKINYRPLQKVGENKTLCPR
jgi:hypothetical protein